MKRITLSDVIAVLLALPTLWTLLSKNLPPNMSLIKEIMPYVGVIGIAIYFVIVHNKRMNKVELLLKAWYGIASSRDAQSVRLFRETFSEKELSKLGFTEDEINKIIGAGNDLMMAEIIPHYHKYLKV